MLLVLSCYICVKTEFADVKRVVNGAVYRMLRRFNLCADSYSVPVPPPCYRSGKLKTLVILPVLHSLVYTITLVFILIFFLIFVVWEVNFTL